MRREKRERVCVCVFSLPFSSLSFSALPLPEARELTTRAALPSAPKDVSAVPTRRACTGAGGMVKRPELTSENARKKNVSREGGEALEKAEKERRKREGLVQQLSSQRPAAVRPHVV